MLKQKLYMVICLFIALGIITTSAINTSANNNEDISDYFAEYAEMTENFNEENILVVKSISKPNDYGAERVIEMPSNIYYLQYRTQEDLNSAWDELRKDKSITVVPNIIVTEIESEDDELRLTSESREFMSWGFEAMGIDHMIEAIEENDDNASIITVAVIDTGVKTSVFNERFPDRTLEGYCIMTCENGMDDTAGHGTHILGTVADGTTDNVNLLMIRAGETGNFSLTNLLTSIEYATEQEVDVLNISAGTVFDFDNTTYNSQYDMTLGEMYRQAWEIEKTVVDEAVATGMTIVGASGNNGNHTDLYPASYDNVISIGAVDRNMQRMTLSNYNAHLNYVAPGAGIYSLNSAYTPDNGQELTIFAGGTSMATPHVTAAVAGLKSFNKTLSFDDITDIFNTHSIDLGDEGRDDYFGNGFINFSDSEFCTPGKRCDKYKVFVDNSPIEIKVPNTGAA